MPVRPRISLRPSTENITAGSVGASAAPSTAASVQLTSSTACANSATRRAVPNVPEDPKHRDLRPRPPKRRHPTSIPPSKRITTSATTPMRGRLDRHDRKLREDIGRDGRDHEEDRGAGDGERSAELARGHGDEQALRRRSGRWRRSRGSCTVAGSLATGMSTYSDRRACRSRSRATSSRRSSGPSLAVRAHDGRAAGEAEGRARRGRHV